jgi:lactate dehydrogenase-like 2-hydroxyacid dehydrogenase
MTEKPVVLTLFGINKAARERLESSYRLFGPFKDAVADVTALPEAREARALVTIGAIAAPPALLDRLPKLELVVTYGAGYESVNTTELKRRGLRLANGRGANARCVSDMALTLLLASVVKLLPADRYIRDGKWNALPPRDWPFTPGVGGKRLGIFGMGEIGLQVARRASPFDLEIAYHNRSPRKDVGYRYFDNVKAMAEWADYLVVSCPLTDATRGAVNADVLKALGPSGYLVNVGRGAVVDEAALIAALHAGTIAGAGIDVTATEPGASPELLGAPNLVVTPHIAAVTHRAVGMLSDMMMANLASHFAGKEMPGAVAL